MRKKIFFSILYMGIALTFLSPLSWGQTEGDDEASAEEDLIHEKAPDWGLPIAGGESWDQAVPIEFNRDYKLNHDQPEDKNDYFAISLRPGMEVTLEIHTFEDDFAGMKLMSADGSPIRSIRIPGYQNMKKQIVYRPTQEGEYMILVGSPDGPMVKDQTVFKVSVSLFTPSDADRVGDTGDTLGSATILEPGFYPESTLGGEDRKDLYGFWGRKDESFTIDVAPLDDVPFVSLTVKVFDGETKTILAQAEKQKTIHLENITLPEDDQYYVEVTLVNPETEIVFYSLDIRRSEISR